MEVNNICLKKVKEALEYINKEKVGDPQYVSVIIDYLNGVTDGAFWSIDEFEKRLLFISGDYQISYSPKGERWTTWDGTHDEFITDEDPAISYLKFINDEHGIKLLKDKWKSLESDMIYENSRNNRCLVGELYIDLTKIIIIGNLYNNDSVYDIVVDGSWVTISENECPRDTLVKEWLKSEAFHL